jgi:(aminoalkyl)phosphonate N-acetyltransferase
MQPSFAINIRPATAGDCQTIYNFLCDLEEMRLDKTAFHAVFRRNLADPCVWYRVAEQAGYVVGFVNLEVTTNNRRTDTIRFYEQTGFVASHRKLVKSLL